MMRERMVLAETEVIVEARLALSLVRCWSWIALLDGACS
jgi:hypothetical protein